MTDTMPQIGGAPYQTPQVRRKLPAPFSRPRIDLDGGRRVKRAWQDTSVTDIKAGDTVAGFGTVASVREYVSVDHCGQDNPAVQVPTWQIRLFNVFGEARTYPGEQRVFAFSQE